MDMNRLINVYEETRARREPRLRKFYEGSIPFLVVQQPPPTFYTHCNTIEELYEANISSFEKWVELPWTDDLPCLEPWIGTGIYANAFGCDYFWRENESPAVHYKYHRIEEVGNIAYPDWRTSIVMRMVLDTIDLMKEKTSGRVPIALTDTQSPFDTATLILDAAEFFTACYAEEKIVMGFMAKLTDLLIEFSRVQIQHIGDAALAKPGHIMTSGTFLRGISISDDNLAVSSPVINERISLPFNQKIAEAFGGLAIHSCGRWTHTMKLLKNYSGIFMIDCAASREVDPNPNSPHEIHDALQGTGIIAKVRVGADWRGHISQLAGDGFRLILHLPYSEADAGKNYRDAYKLLSRVYAC